MANNFCSKCGATLEQGAKICGECGERMDLVNENSKQKVSLDKIQVEPQAYRVNLEKTQIAPQPSKVNLEKTQIVPPSSQGDLDQIKLVPVHDTQTKMVQQRSSAGQGTPKHAQKPLVQSGNSHSSASRNNNNRRAIIGVLIVLVCIWGFFGFRDIFANSESDTTSPNQPQVEMEASLKKDIPQVEKKKPIVTKTELSLGGMDLDETMQDMYDKLGKESYTKSDDGRTYYYYKGSVRVGFTDGKVTSLVSDGTNSTTKRGIHEGSTLQEVLSAYGDSELKFNYGNLELYEYTAKSLAGREGILRFAINSQGKVEYISVRIPQEAKVDNKAIGNEAKEAVASYHKYITNKDYKAAYNLLTPDMQNTMGLYENWTRGFSNTIESRVSDMKVTNTQADSAEISFILVARDRRPGGVEETRFRSTATVVKTGNGWKIADVNNKKI